MKLYYNNQGIFNIEQLKNVTKGKSINTDKGILYEVDISKWKGNKDINYYCDETGLLLNDKDAMFNLEINFLD